MSEQRPLLIRFRTIISDFKYGFLYVYCTRECAIFLLTLLSENESIGSLELALMVSDVSRAWFW